MQKPEHKTIQPGEQGVPLTVRILDRFSHPVAVAFAVAMVLTVAYILGQHVNGHLQGILSGAENSLGFRATVTLFVLIAYVPVAHLYLRRWTRRHLAALTASFGSAIACSTSAPTSITAGLAGAVVFLLLFFIIPINLSGIEQLSFGLIVASLSGIVFGWLAGRFLICMLKDSLRMTRLARSLPNLELLDLGPLSPFVQQGIKSALLTVIVLTLTAHLAIAPGNTIIGSTLFMLIWGGLTLMVFTLPVRGIHDRIRREKQSQLERVRAEIWAAKEVVLRQEDKGSSGRLSALLDLENRLERVRAWPYDASSWLKFGLYMLLGLGSWLGAAAVERLLNSLI